MYEFFDDVIVIIHEKVEDAVTASVNAEIEFLKNLNFRGFDLLYETRTRWWPINYSALSINN